MSDGKTSWPELVGKSGTEAVQIIKNETGTDRIIRFIFKNLSFFKIRLHPCVDSTTKFICYNGLSYWSCSSLCWWTRQSSIGTTRWLNQRILFILHLLSINHLNKTSNNNIYTSISVKLGWIEKWMKIQWRMEILKEIKGELSKVWLILHFFYIM